MTASMSLITMCPTWCELPAGHPWTDVDSADCYRTHRVSFGANVTVHQDEVKDYGDETPGQLRHAWINAEVTIDEGSADDAEQLARQLRAAALRLRAIQAGAGLLAVGKLTVGQIDEQIYRADHRKAAGAR